MLAVEVKSKLSSFSVLALSLAITIVILLAWKVLDDGIWNPLDFYNHLLPASSALVTGGDPYRHGVYVPSYVLFLIYPFTFLPQHLAGALWYLLGIAVCLVVLYKSGIRQKAIMLFFASPPIVHTFALGNLDWLPLLGLIVPIDCAAFFLLAKPQIGFGFQLALLLTGKLTWRGYVLLFLCSISLLAGLGKSPELVNATWNIAIRPYVWSVLIGLLLIWFSLSRNRQLSLLELSILGPLLSPYVSVGNLSGVVLALTSKPKLLAWASAIGWLILLGRLVLSHGTSA